MRKKFIQRVGLMMLLCWVSIATSFAQNKGAYGDTKYFEWTYASVTNWTGFDGSTTFTTTVNGNLLTFKGNDTQGPSRAKGGFTGAVRSQSIELPEFASLGYFSFYVHNGSTGTARNIYVRASTDNGLTWSTVETFVVGGNVDKKFIINSVLSKKPVKIKIDSDGKYFWFHQVEAWSNILATTNVNEPPVMLSSDSAAGVVIPSTGSIRIQFDEFVKLGTGTITFGGATVTTVFIGNTLQVNYTGLNGSSNTLIVPATFVQNMANINPVAGISITFAGDIVDPVYLSASPVDGSNIVINDVLQKIILTFNESIALGAGSISISPATGSAVFTPTVSGKTLVIGYSGLAYSTSYVLTIPADMVTDISGNTYKNAINLNYTTLGPDVTAPLLSSKSTDGTIDQPIGGSLYLTFNEDMELGTGNATLDGNNVTLSINKKMVGINYTNLNYSTTYTVIIPAGVLTDTTGNAYAGTTFTFTTKAQALKSFDWIVAKDGSGDFTTITDALRKVPKNSSQRTFIFVKSGTYNEKIIVRDTMQNVSLIGQDSSNTIITYNDGAVTAGGTDASYTMDVQAPGFYAENLKIKNTYGQGSQAVALMTEGDRQVYKNCKMYGFQDTQYPKRPDTRNYFLNCFIEGATDFMFGSGTVFYESCAINCVAGGQYITAPSGTTREFGLVYNNCTITANSNVAASTFYLGRPWKDDAKTVWLNTKLDNAKLRPEGWAVWATSGDDSDNHLTGFFAEYNTMDLSGAPYNPTRAPWGVKLTSAQAARYTIDNVFNYGIGLNTWNPLPFSTAPTAPTNVIESSGLLSWNSVPFAVGYIVFRNGVQQRTTTNTSIILSSAGNYTVKAVNEFGAQSPASTGVVAALNLGSLSKIGVQIYPNPFTEVITIQNSEKVKVIEFYNANGTLVKQVTSAPTIKTSDLEEGTYILKLTDFNGTIYSQKVIKR